MANGQRQSGGRQRERNGPENEGSIDASKVKAAVLGSQYDEIDRCAESLAREISQQRLTTSQIRNFYGAVGKLRTERDPQEKKRHLALLRSRLAYLTARAGKPARPLWSVFGALLREASVADHIEAFCDFAEAVVAYHKYYEKQNSGHARR